MKFDVIETNFICIYADETKEKTILNIMEAAVYFTEREFERIAENVINKLDTLTEEEFTEYNFSEQFADVAD